MDTSIKEQILTFFKKESPLSAPEKVGKPLRHSRVGLWRYRIGNFSVIVKIKNDTLVIELGKRDKVYNN